MGNLDIIKLEMRSGPGAERSLRDLIADLSSPHEKGFIKKSKVTVGVKVGGEEKRRRDYQNVSEGRCVFGYVIDCYIVVGYNYNKEGSCGCWSYLIRVRP